jgi:hypothetical protein
MTIDAIQEWSEWIMTAFVPSLFAVGALAYLHEKTREKSFSILTKLAVFLTSLMLGLKIISSLPEAAFDWAKGSWGLRAFALITWFLAIAATTMIERLSKKLGQATS